MLPADEVEAELADAIFFNANPRTKSADIAGTQGC